MTGAEVTWAERVGSWRESGQSVQEFSAGKPYAAASLKWWASRLRRSQSASTPTPQPAKRAAAKRVAMARVVRSGGRREPSASRGASLIVEVAEARIVVTAGFDARLLREVVAALEGRR